MPKYINITDNIYPANPKKDNPNVSFPKTGWQGGIVNGKEYAIVEPTDIPEMISFQTIVEQFPEQDENGVWRQVWSISEIPLEQAKIKVARQRKQKRVEKELSGFVYNGIPIDSDRDSILRMTSTQLSALTAIITDSPFEVNWVCADDSIMTMNAIEFLSFFNAFVQHGLNCHNRSQELKNEIENANMNILREINNEIESYKKMMRDIPSAVPGASPSLQRQGMEEIGRASLFR